MTAVILPRLDSIQFTPLSVVKPVDSDHLSELTALIDQNNSAGILKLADTDYWRDKQISFIDVLLIGASDDLLKQVLKCGPTTTLASRDFAYYALSWFIRMNDDGSGLFAMKRLEFLMEAGLLTPDMISYALGRGNFADQGGKDPFSRIEKLAPLATESKVITKEQFSNLVAHILGYDEKLTAAQVRRYVVEKRWTTIAAIGSKVTNRTYRGFGAQYWVTVYSALLEVCAELTDEKYAELDPRPLVGSFGGKDDGKSARQREMDSINFYLLGKYGALKCEKAAKTAS